MPTMAAGHFTEELVAADNSTVLNNIATVLLPEFAGLSLKSLNWLNKLPTSTTRLFKVDEALKSIDEIEGLIVNGNYLKNPTAKNISELIQNPSGAMKLNQKAESILNGQYMFVVDEADNIIIGTRAKGISPF